MNIYVKYIKRLLDIILSSAGIVILFPILIIVGLAIKKKLGSPVIFIQDRPGREGKIFKLYKFRTMTDERNSKGELLPDSKRLPKFGQLLRATSLDELPELWNILKGDMSIVGPRPLLTEYLPLYNEKQKRRHEVRPGLTGYAQVNGRNSISWEEKFKLDLDYVDNITLIGDIKIIFLTLEKVFAREGINSDTSNTMEPFSGSNKDKG